MTATTASLAAKESALMRRRGDQQPGIGEAYGLSSADLRARILARADGTRAAHEIAAEVGCNPATVYKVASAGGGRLKALQGDKKALWPQMVAMRQQGMTVEAIGAALGVSRSYVGRLTRELG